MQKMGQRAVERYFFLVKKIYIKFMVMRRFTAAITRKPVRAAIYTLGAGTGTLHVVASAKYLYDERKNSLQQAEDYCKLASDEEVMRRSRFCARMIPIIFPFSPMLR